MWTQTDPTEGGGEGQKCVWGGMVRGESGDALSCVGVLLQWGFGHRP